MVDLDSASRVKVRGSAAAGRGTLRTVALLVCLAGAALRPAAGVMLPDAASVLEQAIQASGGREAHAALHTRVMHGRMEIPAMGIEGSMVAYAARPNKRYTLIEAASFGTLESGTDGEVLWESTMMTGTRILEGAERAVGLREAAFDGLLRWREFYPQAITLDTASVGGKPCFKLLLTPTEGEPETHYFDQQSYLLRKTETSLVTEMGTIQVETYHDDYRETDGILTAHRVRQVMMGGMQEMIVTIDSLAHNVDLPGDRFDLPADVRALIEGSSATGSE